MAASVRTLSSVRSHSIWTFINLFFFLLRFTDGRRD
jgi:hypothetical protein